MTSRATVRDFTWPVCESAWVVTNGTPPLAEPGLRGLEVRETPEGVDLFDRGVMLSQLAQGSVTVDASDDWALVTLARDDDAVCLLLSRRTPIRIRLRTTTGFVDDRPMVEVPRWDRDGKHLWLRYGSHWEKRPCPDASLLLAPGLPTLTPPQGFVPVQGTAGTTFASERLSFDDALTLWGSLRASGVTALVCDPELVAGREDAHPAELAWELFLADSTPADAVLARRELSSVGRDGTLSTRLDELEAPVDVSTGLVQRRRDYERLQSQSMPLEVPRAYDSPLREQLAQAQVVISSLAPAQLPVALGLGGFNDCPFPDEHAALFAEWARAFGAEPRVMTRDAVELAVARPPSERDALAVAWAHTVYCPESSLPDALDACRASTWFFWWD